MTDTLIVADLKVARLKADIRRLEAEAETFELLARVRRDGIREAEAENSHNGIYHFAGEVDLVTTWSAMRAMERFCRLYPGRGIELMITSPGGSVIAGLGLYDHLAQLKRAQSVHLTTVGIGIAGSMAGLLLQAGDTRVMTRESWLLIHESQFSVEGAMGSVKDTVDWVEKIQERMVDIFVTRSKMPRAQFLKNIKRTNWWLSSADALKHGFVDEVR